MIVDGALAAWLPKSERQMLTFTGGVADRDPSEIAAAVARVLAEQVTSLKRRTIMIDEVDGSKPQDTPMASAFVEAGFKPTTQGYLFRL